MTDQTKDQTVGHSPEPWRAAYDSRIKDGRGDEVSNIGGDYCTKEDVVNAARIVACVNFCAGVHIEVLTLLNKAGHPTLQEICEENQRMRAELEKVKLDLVDKVAFCMRANEHYKELQFKCSQISAQLENVKAENGSLRQAVRLSAVTFRHYEELHRAKGPIGAEKAEQNASLAKQMEDALKNCPTCSPWISVADRLPEKTMDRVLGVVIRDDRTSYVTELAFDCDSEEGFFDCQRDSVPKVILWMPLPEPPPIKVLKGIDEDGHEFTLRERKCSNPACVKTVMRGDIAEACGTKSYCSRECRDAVEAPPEPPKE